MKIKKILIFGLSSNLTFDIIETCERNGLKYILVNNLTEKSAIFDEARFAFNLSSRERNIPVIMGLVSPKSKIQLKISADQHNINKWFNLIDRTSVLPNRVEMGTGIYINSGVLVGSQAKIGSFVTVNRGATIGHHTEIEENVFIGPGATISGHVKIKKNTFIGSGATIRDGVSVGESSTIGAGSVVVKDVHKGTTVVGNPAKAIENRD